MVQVKDQPLQPLHQPKKLKHRPLSSQDTRSFDLLYILVTIVHLCRQHFGQDDDLLPFADMDFGF